MRWWFVNQSSLEKQVLPFMERHQLIHRNATVVIGVSGGVDSLLLLKYYTVLQQEWQLHIIAVSMDHGLRGDEAARDVTYVEQICKDWGVPFVGRKIDVKERKRHHKEGTQQAARILRYQVFEEIMKQYDADYLALAHHGDDQVETVVMRMLRQNNPSALTGIPISRAFASGFIVRPFLCLSKAEIYQYAHIFGLQAREDPSNQSSQYTRNYLRNQVLPLLKKQEPQLHRHVQEMTERLTEDQLYLMKQAEKVMAETITLAPQSASFQINELQSYPMALQRRVFHLILSYLYHKVPSAMTLQHEKDFFHLLHTDRSSVTIDFPSGLKVTKSYTVISFHFLTVDHSQWEGRQLSKIPDTIYLADGASLQIRYSASYVKDDTNTLHIPVELTSLFPLSVRTRKPGDKIRIKGLQGRKKVKDIFIDEKIPLEQRDNWPIVVGSDGQLLWLVGLRKAEITPLYEASEYVVLHYIETNNRRHHDA